uniref:ZP domain-containing protein n=1 Tax=Leptobrachium leishanense TaxID=445787 RepID=A0A8C5PRV9_9ANUR
MKYESTLTNDFQFNQCCSLDKITSVYVVCVSTTNIISKYCSMCIKSEFTIFLPFVVLRTSAVCASDEVLNVNGVCNCNPAKYTSSVTPPIPVIDCSGGKLKVSLKKCQLEISLFNSSSLHLNDNTCVGTVVNENNINNIVLTSTLSTAACGNILTVNTSHITYSNTLVIKAKRRTIITRNDFNVKVSCSYPVSATVKLNTTLNPVVGLSAIAGPGGNAEYIVLMEAFINEGFIEVLTVDTIVAVEDTIYISVNVPELEGSSFAVSVNRIYATGVSAVQYDLLSDGCPAGGEAEGLLIVRQNGNSTESRFALTVFQIAGSPMVNLFAELSICTGTCVKVRFCKL